ncbi:hypothetical protein HanHA300_Chr13g0472341 [Helianthus annuus]|nr:hypothetical protein HanHA300_Chr13g0472341 [Helianthus annuus]KAJ0496823.1 hypothetical protein HanHA89_Chr13g0504231 [Helianthus annuus]
MFLMSTSDIPRYVYLIFQSEIPLFILLYIPSNLLVFCNNRCSQFHLFGVLSILVLDLIEANSLLIVIQVVGFS